MIVSAARPYANAAFAFAEVNNQLDAWSSLLRMLSQAVKDARVAQLLKNPHHSRTQVCELLIDLLDDLVRNPDTKEVLVNVDHFLKLLSEHRRLVLLPEIYFLFEELLAEKKGYLSLTVTTANTLDEKEKKLLSAQLTKQFKKELRLHFDEDKTMMAGLRVRSKSWVMDATAHGQLQRLKSVLMRSA